MLSYIRHFACIDVGLLKRLHLGPNNLEPAVYCNKIILSSGRCRPERCSGTFKPKTSRLFHLKGLYWCHCSHSHKRREERRGEDSHDEAMIPAADNTDTGNTVRLRRVSAVVVVRLSSPHSLCRSGLLVASLSAKSMENTLATDLVAYSSNFVVVLSTHTDALQHHSGFLAELFHQKWCKAITELPSVTLWVWQSRNLTHSHITRHTWHFSRLFPHSILYIYFFHDNKLWSSRLRVTLIDWPR